MTPAGNIYVALAGVLTYPGADYLERVHHCVLAAPSAIAQRLERFARPLEKLTVTELQELFTQTFDLNPVCSLELGWHLFGENYDRGLLMVRIRGEMAQHGVAESGELPDHLTHALLLLDRMERERAADFAAAILLPALEKMLSAICGKGNPYQDLLEAVVALVRERFPEIPQLAPAAPPALRVLDSGAMV